MEELDTGDTMRLLRAEFVRYAVKADEQVADLPLAVGVTDYERCVELLAAMMSAEELEAALVLAAAAIIVEDEATAAGVAASSGGRAG